MSPRAFPSVLRVRPPGRSPESYRSGPCPRCPMWKPVRAMCRPRPRSTSAIAQSSVSTTPASRQRAGQAVRLRSERLVVGLEGGRRAIVPAEVGGADGSVDAQPQGFFLIVQYAGQGRGPVVRLVAADQNSGALIVNGVPQPADVGRDYGSTAGLRLECDEAEGLVVGR